MASYNELNALIDAYINRNGVQAITGQILNGVLKAMVEQIGRGYAIMGVADLATDPGTPDAPESWFASTPGTYTNFGGLVVADAEFALLSYTPSTGWAKTTLTEGITEITAGIDNNVGTPYVEATYQNGALEFQFYNLKGATGDPAGFGTVNATVDAGIGTPSVSVSGSGPDTARNYTFAFHNLKGETGVTSVVATVDNTTGNPSCAVSLVGQELHLDFSGLKGAQGDTGSSVDYPFTIVNNLTTDDATQALSAAQGVVLAGQVSQLEHEVNNFDFTETGKAVGYSSGNLVADNRFTTTGYIPVNQGDVILYNGAKGSSGSFVAFAGYDSSKVYVQSSSVKMNEVPDQSEYRYPVPSGISYLRVSVLTSGFNYAFMESVSHKALNAKISEISTTVGGVSTSLEGVTGRVTTIESTLNGVPDLIKKSTAYKVLASELMHGSFATDKSYNTDAKRATCYKYFDIPTDGKVSFFLSELVNMPSTVRLVLYDSNHELVVNYVDKTVASGVASFDLSSYATSKKFRFSVFSFPSNVVLDDISEKIKVTAEKENEPDFGAFGNMLISATEDDARETLNNTIIGADGNLSAQSSSVCLVFSNDGYKHIQAAVKGFGTTNYPRVAFYSDDTPGSGSLISAYGNDGAPDLYSFDVPDTCKTIVVCSDTRGLSVDWAEQVALYVPRVSAQILRNEKAIIRLQNGGVDAPYNEESERVNYQAISLDCDFRFLVFADPHSLEQYKYLKYANIASKGVIDCVVGVGDYNPYANYERATLKSLIAGVLTDAGREDNRIYVVGNHDVMANFDWIHQRGEYAENQPEISTNYVYTKKEQFEMTARHLSRKAVFNNEDPYGCYYYIDFPPQKTRLIVLNSSDIFEDNDELVYFYEEMMAFHQRQVTWFANIALDFSAKEDPTEWRVAVFVHHYYPGGSMIADLLSAVKNAAPVSKSWSVRRRKEYDVENHHYLAEYIQGDAGLLTVSANKDYSLQGAVKVLGVFYGHSHNDVNGTIGDGIPAFEFIADGYTSHLYKAEVNGLLAQSYYFEILTGNHNVYQITLQDALPGAKYIAYNVYFDLSQRMEVFVYAEDGSIIWRNETVQPVETPTGTEITGFVDAETTEVSKEKCAIVCIDYENDRLVSYPYGNASYRDVII